MKKNLFTKMLIAAISVAMLLSGCSSTSSTQGGNQTENEENKGEEEMTDAEKAYQEYMAGLAKQGGKVTQLDAPEKGEEIAVIHTTMGDIKVKFFPEAAPKAVENFKTLAKDGYYDGIIFHRVINEFMIQGGDPTGTGMGGESCWGTEFEDEFSPDLCNYRGALSMANAGMNTNGSQFFIVQATSVQEGYWDYMDSIIEQYGAENVLYNSQAGKLVKINYSDEAKAIYNEVGGTPHLDYAHTVFGQVFEGMDVVDSIASVATDANDKPADDVIIQSISFENY